MEDLVQVLARFQREVLLPDFERLIEDKVGASERRLRDDMYGLHDAVLKHLERLETEYQMIVAGLKRLEERMDRLEARMDRVEQQLDKMALRSDLIELKSRVAGLQEQERILEASIGELAGAHPRVSIHSATQLSHPSSSPTDGGSS